MTKKAMIELYKEGIIPHIQVHDELDISVTDNADKIKQIMESAVDLEVPNKVDYESGPNWGSNKMINYGLLKCKYSCTICTNKKGVFI
jgi:DNA polymerase I-like protein with 3'-5' exonuclease and polymerase domains